MISEKIVVGGILVIFRSKSQVVPYDEFSENRQNQVICEKNHILTTPPQLLFF